MAQDKKKPAMSTSTSGHRSSSFSQDWVIARPPDTLPALKASAPWMGDPKWFRSVVVSPSAVVKMLAHCDSGVAKGIAKGGNPIEVMGMLLGRPNDDHQLVVTDAFPLPIEGFETRVVADDQAVVNHMIALGENLERTRCEKFMGWYHSHPFELSQHSHCFLSQTDLSTQLQWQRAEDAHGNPFVAIVVDPLRTRHLQEPVLKAFRAYPPEYAPSSPNECPNGAIEPSEQIRLERWGSCWNRYYELSVDYRMTPACRRILEQLTSDSIWIRNLSSSSASSRPKSALSNPAADAAHLRSLAEQCRSAHSALGLANAAAVAAAIRGPTPLSSLSSSSAAAVAAASSAGGGLSAPFSVAAPPAASLALPSQVRGGGGGGGATAAASATGGTFARSEEAMAALTVAPPSQQQQQQTQQGQQAPSVGLGTSAGGTGAATATSSAPSGAAQWAKAVRAVVDAAEDVACNEHRNATKGRVFG